MEEKVVSLRDLVLDWWNLEKVRLKAKSDTHFLPHVDKDSIPWHGRGPGAWRIINWAMHGLRTWMLKGLLRVGPFWG